MKAASQLKKMQGIGGIRLRLGMNQVYFALLLNISRSHLAGCESGRRKMSKGLKRLSWLEIQLSKLAGNRQAAPAPPAAWQQKRNEAALQQLARDAEMSRLTAASLESRLRLMGIQYQTILQQLQEVDMLIASCQAEGAEPPFPVIHLEMHREMLLTQLQECDTHAQTRLQNQVSITHSGAHLHELAIAQLQQQMAPQEISQ